MTSDALVLDLRAACALSQKISAMTWDWIAIRQEQEAAAVCASLSSGGPFDAAEDEGQLNSSWAPNSVAVGRFHPAVDSRGR